jgi:hypothetical protein
MNQFTNSSLPGYSTQTLRFMHSLQQLSRVFQSLPIPELLLQVEQAKKPKQLTRAVNQVQHRLWNLPGEEQVVWREELTAILQTHVLHASQASLRLEAAEWLRMLTQAGLVSQPQQVFVTFVTAATHQQPERTQAEQQAYLKMIFACFWPFRYPQPPFPWQVFPATSIFYPLAPLLTAIDKQDALISIFTELPTLDDPEIVQYLLPVALTWSRDSDPERRRRIVFVLGHMHHALAQEALHCLQSDPNPLVRATAKGAVSSY